MNNAFLILVVANVVYATSYFATRWTMGDVPPATLTLIRLLIGGIVMLPFMPKAAGDGKPGDSWRAASMGLLGLGAAVWLGNQGMLLSSATNAAVLIIVEPIALMLLGPALLGEKLSRREAAGGAVAVAGALLVIMDGIPGISARFLPHWKGDALLVLSGLAYASYSLIGRPLLHHASEERVTVISIFWGAAAMLPFAAKEWASGQRPVWTWEAIAGTSYLALVITALGIWVWNWALRRVEASRAAITITMQPLAGAALGVMLGERLTLYVAIGGLLLVGGLCLALIPAEDEPAAAENPT